MREDLCKRRHSWHCASRIRFSRHRLGERDHLSHRHIELMEEFGAKPWRHFLSVDSARD
jgi:hypothetical protein